MQLRDYQTATVNDAVASHAAGLRAVCYASPTGTGKGLMALATQAALRRRRRGVETWIVTPRVEIVRGLLEKLGDADAGSSQAKLVAAARERNITTPIRLRNMLERGELSALPAALIIDEAHHSTALSYTDLRLAIGRCFTVGFTATPYRGTPAATQEFLATWGEPRVVLTIRDAIDRGVMSCPTFRVVPLLDDDAIDVQSGEFKVRSVASATLTRLDALADLVASSTRDRAASMVSVGSTELVKQLCTALAARGVAAVSVTQETTDDARREAFRRCVAGEAVLVQINVVSEGVDLPIRRLIDASPTMSPVRWVQQLGRITRPGGVSEYICTNRNVERHAYIWAGGIPPNALKAAIAAFGSQSKRAGVRVVGLEKIGKFRPVELPLRGGVSGSLYAWQVVETSGVVREFAAILSPVSPTPFYACRVRGNAETGYGKWEALDAIPDMTDATTRSLGNGKLTDRMSAWWKRSAGHFGLDGAADVNAKAFQALPILADCKCRIEGV